MFAGLDFGTSNCSIGVINNNEPVLVPLEDGETRLSSCIFLEHGVIKAEEVSQLELSKRVRAEKTAQSKRNNSGNNYRNQRILNDDALINIVRKQLRKENREKAKTTQKAQSVMQALQSNSEVIFGKEAELAHISDPENGFYIKSPKSFLGANISDTQQVVFSTVVEKMLGFIKQETEYVKDNELDQVVIGRPVNFHGLQGNDGNVQALHIIHKAAKKVGFKDIEFLMEPVAAAYDYERQLKNDRVVLILDMGGGTTDCSMIKLGPSHINLPSRENCILSYSGKRLGGIDLDNKLALMTIMPHFGKNSSLTNGLPVPITLFSQAVNINDVRAQQEFSSHRTGNELARFCMMTKDKRLERLKQLRDRKLGLRLNQSAERAKIYLSANQSIDLALDYIEDDFFVHICRDELGDAIKDELRQFELLINDSLRQAGTQPDTIFVTGGTAISPVIQAWIHSIFPNVEIVIGNHFGSVTSGLVTHAQRLFK
ncbi:MAG: molecular chaperone [Sinobacterium sp.]